MGIIILIKKESLDNLITTDHMKQLVKDRKYNNQ